MRLAGIGQSRRSHRHLLLAQHIIESAHVIHPILRFAHRQMQCNTKIHFLRRLQLLVHKVAHRIAAQEQIQAAIRQQSIAFGLQESLGQVNFRLCITFKNIGAVIALRREIRKFVVERLQLQPFHLAADVQIVLETIQAAGYKLPIGFFSRNTFYGGPCERVQSLLGRHRRLMESVIFAD